MIKLKRNKGLSLLGLAMKARCAAGGETAVLDAIKSGKAHLVLIAEDASDNSRKLYSDKSRFYEVPYLVWGTKEQLGHAIGKEERSAVAVCDVGLARAILSNIVLPEATDETIGGMNGEN